MPVTISRCWCGSMSRQPWWWRSKCRPVGVMMPKRPCSGVNDDRRVRRAREARALAALQVLLELRGHAVRRGEHRRAERAAPGRDAGRQIRRVLALRLRERAGGRGAARDARASQEARAATSARVSGAGMDAIRGIGRASGASRWRSSACARVVEQVARERRLRVDARRRCARTRVRQISTKTGSATR